MKFAKELERECVPEWRIKYLDYKAGKKSVKAVSTAISRAHISPRGAIAKSEATPHTPRTPRRRDVEEGLDGPEPLPRAATRFQGTPHSGQVEHHSLTRSPGHGGNYGSFNLSPGSHPIPPSTAGSRNPFQLPDPAMRVPSNTNEHPPRKTSNAGGESLSRVALQRSASMVATVPTIGTPATPAQPAQSSPSSYQPSPGRLRRLLSTGPTLTRKDSAKNDVGMQALEIVRQREKEFFDFLDRELEKVESFYQQKEAQAGTRLAALRQQLHEMKNRRTEELAQTKHRKEQEHGNPSESSGQTSGHDYPHGILGPIKSKLFKPGPNSKALSAMPLTPVLGALGYNTSRDYSRRTPSDDVPYRSAKRKLKLALEEFYRGLELLKAYTMLNRTAFRKLNKKYDKAINARPPYRYMNEKVNKAWFVNSDVVDNYIRDVEDLYARYFEGNNHKLAAGKLRRLIRRPGDESATTFHSGLLIGVGGVFLVQGLVFGAELLFDEDPVVREETLYLLQIYGGYFLCLLLFFYFCLDCSVWTSNKINYQFIFEFDPRHQLDWRQLFSFPSFFLMLFGLFFWLNFTRYGSPEMYLYYPVILIGLSLVIILFPAPILWHKSRRWLAYSHNVELFFCLIYTSIWDLLMDFSLLQPDARRKYLRNLLGLKRQWPYYTIMVLDPILRFAWIFYAIFTYDKQHSTIVSFLVAVAEVTRRGMWALIRVENEHCFNVAAYKASRDLPLPYRLPDAESTSLSDGQTSTEGSGRMKSREGEGDDDDNAVASAVDASAAGTSSRMREESGTAGAAAGGGGTAAQAQPTPMLEAGISGLRRRRLSELPGARSIRGIMAEAHRQDFEKKRRPTLERAAAEDDDDDDDDDGDDDGRDIDGSESDDDDDDDEDDDTASARDDRVQARGTESLVKGD
ncbi:Xenotropic and polytropic retrovirus receptor 1 [Diatrype stigma]|uniref:Xenotropic and polytropic retrovirus receptor 1 n=1 Tax=Diatrype stigma TaxID=117547 RepID=A0AAN9UQS8_9PEZI